MEARLVAVERGGLQFLQCPATAAGQQLLRMKPAEILPVGVHVFRELRRIGAEFSGCPVRKGIGVLHPAVGGIEDARQLVEAELAAPVGRGIAAVDRLLIVETVVASRDELRAEVGDLTLVVGKDCIVRTVRFETGNFQERLQVLGPGPAETLLENVS